MKVFLAIPIALLMLVKPLWPIAEYIVNYDFIVNNLCENKDRPRLNCDGMCYLSKQLAKESESDHENPFSSQHFAESLVVFQTPLLGYTITVPIWGKTKNIIPFSKTLFSSSHLFVLIQPPELS